jgi:hypothetical protein
MYLSYGHFRPYPGRLGGAVRSFVEGQGFTLGRGGEIEAGISNQEVARAIIKVRLELIVLPFHLHRAKDGSVLDAVGVLLQLPVEADIGRLTFFMPVRDFSWGASFQRRLDELSELRPHFISRILVAHESELGTPALAARLRRVHERRRVTIAPLGPSSRPLSLLPQDGQSFLDLEPWSEDVLRQKAPPSLVPPNSLPTSGWVTVRPPVSGDDIIGLSANLGDMEADVPESARERFRRAAELGAKARIRSLRSIRSPKKIIKK